MSDAFLSRVQRAFEEVAGAPREQREALLERACGGDARVRAEVESLLRSDQRAGPFMALSVVGVLADGDAMVGERFGPYLLDELIGEGGMGAVYRAHRADGAYEQDVVVKLIRGHARDPDLARRFHRERQVLASLRHASIARLLDGGIAGGLPYLVMELVNGADILTHCDDARLDVAQRLELFDAVCAGVQHAHSNLVVHRDLKPGHVVVDEDGRPKLLDFGVAALLGREGSPAEGTVQRWMTPQYASPEQVRGEAVTTATDVYALGLILYELLVGRRPYGVGGGTSEADRRAICETAPMPPSRRLEVEGDEGPAPEQIAAVRATSPPKLRRVLNGDLGRIVLTALRKEPERRYASAEALREDLRRYREGLPIAARADSWGYRTRKFVGRHRAGVGAAGVLAAVMLAASVATSRQAAIAAERREQAEAALATSDTVGRFLRSILVAADPREGGQDVTMREALDQAAERIEAELGDVPEVEARVREAVGMTYRALGALGPADAHLTRAHELAQRLLADDPEAARIAHELAVLRLDQGRLEASRELAERAFWQRQRMLGPLHDETLTTRNVLALVSLREGRREEALAHARAVVEGRGEAVDDARTLEARNTLAEVLKALGRHEEAVALLREVYDAQARMLGAQHPDTLISANDLGATLFRTGRRDEGLDWQIRAMEGLSEHFPPGSLDWVIPRINIAGSLIRMGRLEEAKALAEEAVRGGAPALGEDHYVLAVARLTLGRALTELGELESARRELKLAHAVLHESLGPENQFTSDAADALERLASGG